MSLSDDMIRHLKALERRYGIPAERICPDSFTGYEIAALKIQHEHTALTYCSWCGAPTRQPLAFLGRESKCTICAVLNP
jgi:hypothetical protein